MAIIDSKVAEEAQRQAREYAQRNDTAASQDWQQPPPAYEEAPVATSSSSNPTNHSTSVSQAGEDQALTLPTSRQIGSSRDSIASDESLPLLTRRQEQRLRRKRHLKSRVKRGVHFIVITLLLACIILLLLELTGSFDADDILPPPVESDGEPIGNPDWSPGKKTDPDSWADPHTPLYSSFSKFSFDAFKAHFIHEYSNGAINSGQVNVVNADPLPDSEWKECNQGVFYDRIHVSVEVRYSDVALRNAIRVNKMQMSPDKEGIGIYGPKPKNWSPHAYVSFHIFVYLPSERQRTRAGLMKDGSSYISELDLDVDNMRVGIEAMQNVNEQDTGYITFGDLKSKQSNGPMTLVYGLRANNSIDLRLQNGPVIDLKGGTQKYSMISPRININVVNGPIWLNGLIAKDEINLKTLNGGIKITEMAVAKSIKVKHATGFTGGTYRAEELDIYTSASDTNIIVDLTRDLYSGIPEWREERETERIGACQPRQVKVQADAGDVTVTYQNHDSHVQLHSILSVKTGAIKVNHDRSFEGTFDATNTVGTIEISDPHSLATPLQSQNSNTQLISQEDTAQANIEKKVLVIVSEKRNPAGKSIEGRTWWPSHSWNEKNKFCPSISHTRTRIGRIGLYF